MAEQSQRLEITARLIDLGGRIVPVAQLASAGIVTSSPLRPIGIAMLLATVGLVGSEAMNGLAAFSLKTGGSFKLWLGFGIAGIGCFLTVYSRRQLIIETTGRSRVRVPAADEKVAATVLDLVREAVSAHPATPLHYRVDLTTGAVETLTVLAMGARHDPVFQPQGQPPLANGHYPGQGLRSSELNGAHPAGSYPSGPARNAHPGYSDGGPAAGSGAGNHQQGTGQGPHSFGAAANGRAGNHKSGPHAAAGPHPAPTGRPSDADPAREIARLIEFVSRTSIQHKDTLIELLRVVEDHARGGSVGRDDAIAHWRSFADYADQYLRGVDGLMPMTESVGRHLQT